MDGLEEPIRVCGGRLWTEVVEGLWTEAVEGIVEFVKGVVEEDYGS